MKDKYYKIRRLEKKEIKREREREGSSWCDGREGEKKKTTVPFFFLFSPLLGVFAEMVLQL